MQRLATAIVAMAIAGGGLWLARRPSLPAPEPPPESASAARPSERPATPVPVPAAPRTAAAPGPEVAPVDLREPPLDEETAEALLREETVRDRLYRLALEEEARQRFDDSLERSGITADEIEAGVKRLFETVRVEPVLERGGRMDGMILRGLDAGHPFHRAGFREGDRLTRLDDWRLDDAGILPDVLIRLKRRFVACAVAEGADREVCREVEVGPAG